MGRSPEKLPHEGKEASAVRPGNGKANGPQVEARREKTVALGRFGKEAVESPLVEEEGFRKQGRRARQPDSSEGGQQNSNKGMGAAQASKRPRFEYTGSNQLSPEARAQLMEAGKCFRCHQVGHREFDTKVSSSGCKFLCPERSSETPKPKTK